MYPNHYIERRLICTSIRQLAKESHIYRVFFYVRQLFILLVSVELRTLRGPLSIPGFQMSLMQRCRKKMTLENCSYRRKACTIAISSTTNSAWNALAVNPVTSWLCVARADSVVVQYVSGYYCTLLLNISF